MTLPWEDVEVALQTGELDGWPGRASPRSTPRAGPRSRHYFLTNNISGAWIGHFFANMERWNAVPPHLQELLKTCFDQSHYHRQWWYWAGEAKLRVEGAELTLTTIPDEECAKIEAAAQVFWDEIAAESPLKAKIVDIISKYNDTMVKAGPPYRYG